MPQFIFTMKDVRKVTPQGKEILGLQRATRFVATKPANYDGIKAAAENAGLLNAALAERPLVLSGHIHEAPRVSGSHRDQVGRTIVVNPGQFGIGDTLYADSPLKYPAIPRFPAEHFGVARLRDVRFKQFDEAIRSYELILRQYADHPLAADAQYKLAQCYEEAGQFQVSEDGTVAFAQVRASYRTQMEFETLGEDIMALPYPAVDGLVDRLEAEGIKVIEPADVVISKEGSEVTLSASWTVKIPFVSNISVVIDFAASSNQ